MPVKNTANYLPECLDSILAQSYDNWQLIAIDDGSSDASFDILQAYAEKDERVQTHKNTGKGIIDALRLAYKQSHGEYITRMDSDDKMSLNKIQMMLEALRYRGKKHLAVGLVEYFADFELGQGYARYADWLNDLSKQNKHYQEIYKECVIPSPCWMIHREDFEHCEAFRPDVYPEDYDLCFRFYQQNIQITPVLETLHYWRDYSDRTSRNDPNYLDNRFTHLKIHYFLQLDYQKEQPLVLWGAGKKGKAIAKLLQENQIAFHWVCDNVQKIGKDIYNVKMEHFEAIKNMKQPQVIVSVSSPNDILFVKEWLRKDMIEGFFFS